MGSCGWFPLSYDEIVAWVAQHRDTLPITLTELSAYPVAFRRVIVNAVDVERRTTWWQDHVRSFLAPSAGLSDEQRAFVADAIPILADIFRSESRELMLAKMGPLEEKARKVLSREQAATMFGMLGPSEPPEGLPLPPGTRLTPVE